MKIAIIGNPGSGKSTLAAKLHAITGIPVYHLDQYFWKPGWERPDREEFRKIHHELCDKEAGLPAEASGVGWIIEGMAVRHFDYRAQKADVIIFLDIPLWLCLYRILKRALTRYGTVSVTAPEGCSEKIPSWEFLSYVWNFNRERKPEIESILAMYKDKKKIFVVKNDTDLKKLIKKIASYF